MCVCVTYETVYLVYTVTVQLYEQVYEAVYQRKFCLRAVTSRLTPHGKVWLALFGCAT